MTGRFLEEKYKEFGHKKAATSFVQLTDGSHFLARSIDNSTKYCLLSHHSHCPVFFQNYS